MTVEGDDDGGDRWNKLMTSRWAAGKRAVGEYGGVGMDVQIARCPARPGTPHTAAGLPLRHSEPIFFHNPELSYRVGGELIPLALCSTPLHSTIIALGLPLYSAGLESLRLRRFYAPPPRDRVDGGWSLARAWATWSCVVAVGRGG